jgi:hypothetical protein
MAARPPAPVPLVFTCPAAPTIVCDARELRADMATVDALAQLHLAARRRGRRVRFRGASAELLRLIELAGLAGVLDI